MHIRHEQRERGADPKQQGGADGEGSRRSKYAEVEVRFGQTWHACADDRDNRLDEPYRQHDAAEAAQHRVGKAFGQQLADDAQRPAADGHPHRDLPAPRAGARQQQVCHVGAGNQQHDERSREQDAQRAPRRTNDLVLQRHDDDRSGAEGRWVIALIPAMNRVNLGAGLLDRDPGLQFTDRLVDTYAGRRCNDSWRGIHSQHSIRGRFGGVEIHDDARRLQLWVEGDRENGGNGGSPSIKADHPPNHAGIAVEQPHEHPVGNRERLRIGLSRQRAEHWLRAGHVPESRRGRHDAQS